MVKRYDFFDTKWNVSGYFENDFVDNGDGTVTDMATGLMWQRTGTTSAKRWSSAKPYINKLNKIQFAGYSDWRLPTIDELASLIEKKPSGGLHLDPLFGREQKCCWSSDNSPGLVSGSSGLFTVWIVNFAQGRVKISDSEIRPSNYFKAVRSLR